MHSTSLSISTDSLGDLLTVHPIVVTRSHKQNDRDHAGLANGSAEPEDRVPRYFAKAGHADADPRKTKKDGAGKGNWGRSGGEHEDLNINMTNARRRTNSSSDSPKDFRTKFDFNDPEPVFEEEVHGPFLGDLDFEKESSSGGSVTEEESAQSKVLIDEKSTDKLSADIKEA
ncbi:MAG: hypothetical protein M1814_004663 [Vezdaea aestivalis]|nr:MAG: hypothetical protein M1814_004663 [Vezdaea aestivalis]